MDENSRRHEKVLCFAKNKLCKPKRCWIQSYLVPFQTQNDSLLFAILVLTHYMLPDILLHHRNKDRFRNGENSSIICQTWQFIERLKCSHFLYRCLMVSTNQSDPSCFYFRITWILMERRWFYFFRPINLLQGLRSNNIK